jgi:DNA-binding response OmpR family regulator
VRAVARRLLAHLGYRVVTARTASEARVALVSKTAPVDLLITDVTMPGESGVLLARRARARRPGLGVLLVSARTPMLEELEREFGPMLGKPFTLEALAAAVRTALDGRPDQK